MYFKQTCGPAPTSGKLTPWLTLYFLEIMCK